MLKRGFDIIFSFLGLMILAPLLLLIAFGIKVGSPGPVFYRGVRVGRKGKLFKIYKFRTMIMNAEASGVSSTSLEDKRVTKIGKLLRAYKIDELPQLINILKGEMSFVGPRPQVKWATDLYSQKEKAILSVRPGLTDWASIKFHNEGDILSGSNDPDKDYLKKIHPEKTRLQLAYVNNQSFWVDIKIIAKTLWIIAQRKNQSA